MKRLFRFLLCASWPLILVGSGVIALFVALVPYSSNAWERHQAASAFPKQYAAEKKQYEAHKASPQWAECMQVRKRCVESDISSDEILRSYVCESKLWKAKGLNCLSEPLPPESAFAFAMMEHRQMPPAKVLLGGALVWAVLLLVVALLRAFVAEPHPGWKRLAMISPAVGLVGGWAFGWAEYESVREELIAVSLAGSLLSFAVLVFGRRVALWVLEGFGRTASSGTEASKAKPDAHDVAEDRTSPKATQAALSGKAGKALAICAVAAFAMFIHVLMNPERALETTLSAVFTCFGIVFVVYVMRRIAEAVEYWRGQ